MNSIETIGLVIGLLIAVGCFALYFWLAARRAAETRAADSRPRICPNPNCGYRGAMLYASRQSCLVAGLLFCFGILPGLVYVLLTSGRTVTCPKCRIVVSRE